MTDTWFNRPMTADDIPPDEPESEEETEQTYAYSVIELRWDDIKAETDDSRDIGSVG